MNEVLKQFNFYAILDILIIASIIYHLLLIIRGTKAAQMLTGVFFLVVAFAVANFLPLTTLNWLMNKFYPSFLVMLVILFQDDIRHVLSQMGRKSMLPTNDHLSSYLAIDEVTRAAFSLAAKRVGALIVIERHILLNRYVEVGSRLDALVSWDLLMSIFQTNSPIHDGAVIIQRGRVAAAGCFLPLTRQEGLDPNIGTRRRAALGMSQETDALVVLVSEEEGSVSLVVDGKILQPHPARDFRAKLQDLILQNETGQVRAGMAEAASSVTTQGKVPQKTPDHKPMAGRLDDQVDAG